MNDRVPCIFDTNSLISAFLIKTSVSRQAFDKALDYYQILISNETAAEFDDVSRRGKFKSYLKEGERGF
jgi:predicted nucleic acid-binding protein